MLRPSDRVGVRQRSAGSGFRHRRLQEFGTRQLQAGQAVRQQHRGLVGRFQDGHARRPPAVLHQRARRVHPEPVRLGAGGPAGRVTGAVHGPRLHDRLGPASHVRVQLHSERRSPARHPTRQRCVH